MVNYVVNPSFVTFTHDRFTYVSFGSICLRILTHDRFTYVSFGSICFLIYLHTTGSLTYHLPSKIDS